MCKWFSTPIPGGASSSSSISMHSRRLQGSIRPSNGGVEVRRVRIECGSSHCKYSRMNPDNPHFYGAQSRAPDIAHQPQSDENQIASNARDRPRVVPSDSEKKEMSKAKSRASLDALIVEGDEVAAMIDKVGLFGIPLNVTHAEISEMMENDEFFEGLNLSA
ncbi:hypothetical protein TWF694_002172 [Orbilia ellipsospora]|uniref:Uncharacterized protein n=1 Tax=Orbilia ellipsospora TaxID=2528407 RepID=A0AAV9X648_9PEZI